MAETWTEPRVLQLKELFASGLSARQIAIKLGEGLTRSAVIGKVGRLGLRRDKPVPRNVLAAAAARKAKADPAVVAARRSQATKLNAKTRVYASRLVPKQSPARAAQRAEAGRAQFENAMKLFAQTEAVDLRPEEITATAVRLIDVKEEHCRWPIGDPASNEFRFCGRQKNLHSYCAIHARMAYRPSTSHAPEGPEEAPR